jgi:hypothetical protein
MIPAGRGATEEPGPALDPGAIHATGEGGGESIGKAGY